MSPGMTDFATICRKIFEWYRLKYWSRKRENVRIFEIPFSTKIRILQDNVCKNLKTGNGKWVKLMLWRKFLLWEACFIPTYSFNCPINLLLFFWCVPDYFIQLLSPFFFYTYIIKRTYHVFGSVGRRLQLHWPFNLCWQYYFLLWHYVYKVQFSRVRVWQKYMC